MQRASQQRPMSFAVSTDRLSEVRGPSAVRLFDEPLEAHEAPLDVVNGVDSSRNGAQRELLAAAIEERIRSRLLGRVRNLKVEVHDDVVTLHGQCATYYTKQLAQHAAMGVLEDEHLENAIVVCVGP